MSARIFLALLLLPLVAQAQHLSGRVLNQRNEPLVGALVHWLGANAGASTDTAGAFQLSMQDAPSRKLVAHYAGYLSDTIEIARQNFVQFHLQEVQTLQEVVVKGRQQGVVISDINPIKIEQITQVELTKAACCDLAGCFETQTTVQPQTTNVLTNAKELRILGLSGVYNQILLDGLPLIQGLTYTYGISSLPGTLVDNIFVAKGANSVLQGFESISGQINVETKDPDQAERLLMNAYLNSFAEKHFNAHYAFRQGKWSNLTALHTVQPASRVDRDRDHFMDLPLLTRYMAFNQWKYGNDKDHGWHSRVGLRWLSEQRIGGQTNFQPRADKGSTQVYGQSVALDQPEIWTKTGYRINDQHRVALLASAFHQRQNAYFGSLKYDARQTNFYANLQYELSYAAHELKTGFSYRHLDLREHIAFTDTFLLRTYAGIYHRLENIPGFFAEHTMRLLDEKLTWIAGIRADRHNQFGLYLTPRTLVKYDITPRTILRANAGAGWRTVNVFSENVGLLASSRDVVFAELLLPERAVNLGINLTQKFESHNDNLSGYISMDYYRTSFQNQIFPDYDADPAKAILQNFTGVSISHGFQAEVYANILQRFELKTGYNFLDVYRQIGDSRVTLPFNPTHKLLTTFSYKPLTNYFHFDVNVHWYGRQRLPNTQTNPPEFQRPAFSQPFAVCNAQFTYTLDSFEVYAGCENIFDFRQLQPIISWQNPFSPYFDTSSVWGPTRGREWYLGVRYRLEYE